MLRSRLAPTALRKPTTGVPEDVMANDNVQIHWLFRSPTTGMTRWSCCKANPDLSGESTERHFVIAMPRRGVFVRHSQGECVVADANHAVFFNRDQPYRTEHPYGCGDSGVTIVLAEDTLRDIVEQYDPDVEARHASSLLRFDTALSDTRSFLLQKLLVHVVEASAEEDEDAHTLDTLAVEETSIALSNRLIRSSYRQRDVPRVKSRPSHATRQAHREAARGVMGVLASRYGESWTLERLAREVYVSPFHLCRIFRAESGLSIHQYLMQLRLRNALDQLDGGVDLGRLALESGFSSHSHFTSAFRRAFGTTPSAYRRATRSDTVARIRRILKDIA